MAVPNSPPASRAYLDLPIPPHLTLDLEEDNESLASLNTDDGQLHLPEKILAQVTSKHGFEWYLVKWQDCSILRSSWEDRNLSDLYPGIFRTWQIEQKNQAKGKSPYFDLEAFNKAVSEVEQAERQRRILRRLKRQITRVISIVAD